MHNLWCACSLCYESTFDLAIDHSDVAPFARSVKETYAHKIKCKSCQRFYLSRLCRWHRCRLKNANICSVKSRIISMHHIISQPNVKNEQMGRGVRSEKYTYEKSRDSSIFQLSHSIDHFTNMRHFFLLRQKKRIAHIVQRFETVSSQNARDNACTSLYVCCFFAHNGVSIIYFWFIHSAEHAFASSATFVPSKQHRVTLTA